MIQALAHNRFGKNALLHVQTMQAIQACAFQKPWKTILMMSPNKEWKRTKESKALRILAIKVRVRLLWK